jgi:hypothetical protein
MRNGVIGIPLHDLKQQSSWYYGVKIFKNYEFAVVTYGITSAPSFKKILSDIT